MLSAKDIDTAIKSIREGIIVKYGAHECVLLENFLTTELSQRALDFFKDPSVKEWQSVRLQEDLPRKAVEESSHPAYSSVDALFRDDRVINHLGALLQTELRSVGVSFWKDSAGYELPLHVENPAFNCALQIYIAERQRIDLGTSIATAEGEVLFTLPYRHNYGYLLKSANTTPHGLLTRLPEGFERYSIYARFLVTS